MNKVTLSVAALAAIGGTVQVQAAEQTVKEKNAEIKAALTPVIEAAINEVDTKYPDVKVTYHEKLSALMDELVKAAESETKLIVDSYYTNAVNDIKNAAKSAQEPYTLQNELLNDVTSADIYSIKELQSFFDTKNATVTKENYPNAYASIKAKMDAQKTAIANLKARIEGYDLSTRVIIAEKGDLVSNIGIIKSSIENIMTNAPLEEANLDKYTIIAKGIETAKAEYNQKLQDAIKLLPSGDNGEYGNWQKKAIEDLNEQYRIIVAVEKSNGTAESHENAAANYEENYKKLTDANSAIENILKKYTTNKNTEEDAKAKADELYNEVNTQYTNLNTLLTKCEVASKWATQLTEISTALSTMKSNITTHYSNGHNDLSSFDYAGAKTAIAAKITQLKEDSQPDVDNWNAWDGVNTKIKSLRSSKNKAVEAATAAVSADKQYNAAAHMTKFAEAIEGAISALETLNNTAKAGGTAVENAAAYDDAEINSDITNYGTYAAAALASYNTAQDKIAKAEAGLATLKKAVGDDVLTTVDAIVGGKTYKETIDGIEAEIKAIKDQVAVANSTDEKTGVKHKTEMGKAAAKTVYSQTDADNIKLAIEGLAKQYTDTDKQQFEKNNKIAAADKIVTDAKTLVSSLKASLDKAVKGDGVETVYTEDDLGNQKEALVGTEGVITKLYKAIDAATTKDGKDLIPSDWDSKSAVDKYKEAEGVITSLKVVIATLNGLTTEVEAAAQKADEARDNYSRYKATYPKTAPITDGDNASATAKLIKSTQDKVALYETSYYTTLLSGYVADLAQLRTDVQKAYDELKMAKLQETLEISISELYDNVAAVEGAAKANEDAHTAQVAKVTGKDGLQDIWNAAYKYISENDESTKAKDYLAELGPLQEAITNLKTAIQTSYDNGKSVADGKATIDAEIERITKEIAGIRARQEAGYVQAIQNDNDAQHNLFTNATDAGGSYEVAVKAYNNAVDVLTQFSKIKNEALQEAIKDANLVKTHDEIYDYANKLRDLFSRESNKYTTTVSPVVYSSEDFCIEATKYKDEINTKLASYQKTVNDEALRLYKNNIQKAVDALDAAKLVVGAWDNYKKDPASAFADIAKNINDASVAANISGTGSVDPMFAVKIDNWLEILDATKLSQKIEADKLAAAKNEFSLQYKKVVELYASEVATINTYTSIATSTYLKDLATKKAAVDQANSEWAKVKDAEKATNCTTYVNKVKAYYDARVGDAYDNEHSKEYNDATAASVASEANIAAHEEMIGKMNKAEISINEVLEYIDALFITHKKGSAVEQEIDRIVDEYEDMLDQIESWYQAGECADNLEFSFRNYVNPKLPGSLPQSLDLLKAQAINDEVPALKTEIDRVKEEYNKAVKENGLKDEDIAKKEAAIAALYKTLVGPDATDATDAEKCIQTRLNEGLLEGDAAIEELVALHSEIASLSKSLTDTYDAAAYANAVAEVKVQSDALNDVVVDIVTRAAEFDAVSKKYGEDIAAAKNALAAIDFDFEKMNADNQILFYKNNLLNQYDRLNSDINSWKADFYKMHAKYTVNKQVYESLVADLASYKAELDRVNGEVADFKNTVIEYGTIDGVSKNYNSRYLRSTNISTAIKNAETALNTAYTNVTLENGDKGKYILISKDIVAYERKAKYDEVNSYDIPELLATAISDVEDYVDEINPLTGKKANNYSNATASSLRSSISSLNKNKDYANWYNNASYYSDKIWSDLDGTSVGDAGQTCPYLSADGWTAVRERVQALISQAESLLKEAKDKAYTQGDADHNRKVNVNDYSVVRNWILTAKNFEDIEEAKAYGGDVNGDKKFDVADLTCISNIIFDIDYELPELAKSAARAKVVDAENSLSVASESEETTIFGKTVRLAVNINNVAAFTAGQMDITLPQGMKLAGQSLSDRANGHELLANEISGGKYRLVASTVENNEFLGNGGALIYLDVEVGSDFAGGSISVDNAIFTDAKANSYYLTANGPIVPTGIDGIEAATVKERIYSVGGQMMKAVKKGLNIIVGDDNKAKKVVK